MLLYCNLGLQLALRMLLVLNFIGGPIAGIVQMYLRFLILLLCVHALSVLVFLLVSFYCLLPVGEIPWEIGFWDQGICSGNN